ncbi:unnamed protein product, partial [Polarella glacialis]
MLAVLQELPQRGRVLDKSNFEMEVAVFCFPLQEAQLLGFCAVARVNHHSATDANSKVSMRTGMIHTNTQRELLRPQYLYMLSGGAKLLEVSRLISAPGLGKTVFKQWLL